MEHPIVEGFAPASKFPSAGVSLPVYVSEAGTRPLIVLHELPGMSPTFIDYCRRMAGEGYKVYMPLMFKAPETSMTRMEMGLFCVSREFGQLFRAGGGDRHSRPFTRWLLGLVAHVANAHPDAKLGVVGMCLTGGFSLAAIGGPNVSAAIACQPSWPGLFKIHTLALSASERSNAAFRANLLPKPCAKGYRYAGDGISRDAHMKAAQDLLGDSFARYDDLPGKAHSTLTTDSASEDVFQDVLDFLNTRLA